MNPIISWFEIPATDFQRCIRFYEALLDVALRREDMGPLKMAIFPKEADSGGAVVFMAEGQGQRPGPMGTLVYLNGGDDLSAPLARVESCGGAIIVAKTLIAPEIGYFAVFRDSEGNHVGLFSPH